MFVDYSTTKHAIGYPAACVAQHYGEHTPSVVLTSDTDNGNIIGIGDWDHMDVFKETTPTTLQGKIVAQNVDGTYLVLVTKAQNAALVYQKPENPIESPKSMAVEDVMTNKAGSVVRTYVLHALDRIAVSAQGFSTKPVVGKAITGVTSKKLVVATA